MYYSHQTLSTMQLTLLINICIKISPNNLGNETKHKETNPNYNLLSKYKENK